MHTKSMVKAGFGSAKSIPKEPAKSNASLEIVERLPLIFAAQRYALGSNSGFFGYLGAAITASHSPRWTFKCLGPFQIAKKNFGGKKGPPFSKIYKSDSPPLRGHCLTMPLPGQFGLAKPGFSRPLQRSPRKKTILRQGKNAISGDVSLSHRHRKKKVFFLLFFSGHFSREGGFYGLARGKKSLLP